jgi:hypothetical protein
MKDYAEGLPVPTGTLHIKAYDDKGNFLWEETTKNLIVNDGKTQICHLLAADVANRSITTIGFGTNNTAPAAGDTALTGSFTKAIGAASYPTATSVQFAWTLATTEANGITIYEFGLICANSKLFSRLTRGGIAKTNAISLVGTWTLSY